MRRPKKKIFPLPLKIDCSGLSQKAVYELADRLAFYFYDVDIVVDTVFAENPVSEHHYWSAWKILDLYDVKFD